MYNNLMRTKLDRTNNLMRTKLEVKQFDAD